MSRCLTDRRVEHVVLERGRVAERWRSERWESLRLLTPRWQSRLPGWSYRGPDPDGYMSRQQVVDYLADYARSFAAPVEAGVTVTAVDRDGGGFRVATDRGEWRADNVIIATGACARPRVPEFAAALAGGIAQIVPSAYRAPGGLPAGGVLVVGGSATGVQLAEEIHRSGRPVTLAVGRHTRLPRRYRGRDIQWWLDALGIWDERIEDQRDPERARREPSPQLVGTPDHRSLDLAVLQRLGVRLAGRAVGAAGDAIALADDLAASVAASQARLERLLRRIDDHVERHGLAGEVTGPEPVAAVRTPAGWGTLSLRRAGIRTVVWATGYRRDYSWLRLPVVDERGEIRHRGGVTPEPGLYVLGLPFQRTRKSSFLDGVGADAAVLADHLAARAEALPRVAA